MGAYEVKSADLTSCPRVERHSVLPNLNMPSGSDDIRNTDSNEGGGHARDDQEVAMDGHTISLNLALNVVGSGNSAVSIPETLRSPKSS